LSEEALSMRKIREVLRLSALGLAQHQIARSCSIVQSTVHKYLKLAEAAQLRWPLPEDLSNQKLDQLLFGQRAAPPSRRIHPPPDFAAIHKELQSHKDLTLELLWQEYKQADAGGYAYSRFCDLYREWNRAQNFTLRQQHNPGEKLFVDYAGATIPIRDREAGEVHQAAIFVAAMDSAVTPSPRPPGARSCPAGSDRTSVLSSISVVCPGWLPPTIQRRE
jgi:transposase